MIEHSQELETYDISIYVHEPFFHFFFFFLMNRQPPRSPLFPYPTLFRSLRQGVLDRDDREGIEQAPPERDHLGRRTVVFLQSVGTVVVNLGGGRVHGQGHLLARLQSGRDRKSTRLNSSHSQISYAVFCLK